MNREVYAVNREYFEQFSKEELINIVFAQHKEIERLNSAKSWDEEYRRDFSKETGRDGDW